MVMISFQFSYFCNLFNCYICHCLYPSLIVDHLLVQFGFLFSINACKPSLWSLEIEAIFCAYASFSNKCSNGSFILSNIYFFTNENAFVGNVEILSTNTATSSSKLSNENNS